MAADIATVGKKPLIAVNDAPLDSASLSSIASSKPIRLRHGQTCRCKCSVFIYPGELACKVGTDSPKCVPFGTAGSSVDLVSGLPVP